MTTFAGVARILAIASLSGCLGASSRDRLLEAVHGYNDAVRWGQPVVASVYVIPEEREDFAARHRFGEDPRIADYEISRVDVAEDKSYAHVLVDLTWHLRSDGLIRRTVLEQRWEQKSGRWALVSEKRVGGEPMPGPPATASVGS